MSIHTLFAVFLLNISLFSVFWLYSAPISNNQHAHKFPSVACKCRHFVYIIFHLGLFGTLALSCFIKASMFSAWVINRMPATANTSKVPPLPPILLQKARYARMKIIRNDLMSSLVCLGNSNNKL